MNSQWLNTSGLAGRASSPLNPANNGLPAVDFSGFGTNYDNAVTALLGMDVEVNAQYNYNRDGTTLAQGSPVVRHFAENGYETYIQDTWKVKPTLTLTFGLRYSLFSPPWETNGLEVTPTESLNTWFNERVPQIRTARLDCRCPSGVQFFWSSERGNEGYYGWDYKDLGPRVALAWSPGFENGLLGMFSAAPGRAVSARDSASCMTASEKDCSILSIRIAFGLSTNIPNAAASETVACTPRVTGLNAIPQRTTAAHPFSSGAHAELPRAVSKQSGTG